jgi:hypothetical protein
MTVWRIGNFGIANKPLVVTVASGGLISLPCLLKNTYVEESLETLFFMFGPRTKQNKTKFILVIFGLFHEIMQKNVWLFSLF